MEVGEDGQKGWKGDCSRGCEADYYGVGYWGSTSPYKSKEEREKEKVSKSQCIVICPAHLRI